MMFNDHGSVVRRHTTMVHHQAPAASPLRRTNAAAASSAFRPIGAPHGGSYVAPTQGGAFVTPTKSIRAAPQCSPSIRAGRSPTSVVAYDRHFPSSGHGSGGSGYGSPRAPHGYSRGYNPSTCRVIGSSRNNGGHDGGGATSPSPHKKYKTEMCKNMTVDGYCRFGLNCHYAHSPKEQARHSPNAEDVMKDGRLLFPCPLMTATGVCPYDHRCKSLHDPRTATYPTKADAASHGIVVLEHCTKAKRSGDAVPDRLYHRHINSIRQSNPLIAPYVWEARPTAGDAALEFQDTYNLVCNAGPNVRVFPESMAVVPSRTRRTGSAASYSEAVNKNIPPPPMLDELQKLCIVLQMRARDDAHLDFVYAPKDCINGQPCMVLQTRYFRLLDIEHIQQPKLAIDDIIAEVSFEDFNVGKGIDSHCAHAFVSAHEVAFDSKGLQTCNLSIWFDTKITDCSMSKAKKMSKKKDEKEKPMHLDDGALFLMPNNANNIDFELDFPTDSPPYVFMQPIEDLTAGHQLVKCIIEHRVATILHSRRFSYNDLSTQLELLRRDYARIKKDIERWAWDETSDRDHGAKPHEKRNQTPYSPPSGTTTSKLWLGFVANLNADEEAPDANDKHRLPVFRGLADNIDAIESTETNACLPRIESTSLIDTPALEMATWAIEAEAERRRKNVARSTPVSPFSR